MRLFRIAALLLVVIVAQGCLSNEIYLDAETKEICSANAKRIRHFSVTGIQDSVYYYISWSDTEKNAPRAVSLTPLTPGYTVKRGWMEEFVSNKDFKLKSNCNYLIERDGGGDAGPFTIEVVTDKEGHILSCLDCHEQ